MDKFEPGDLVIGRSEADDEYAITDTDTIWKVLKCFGKGRILVGTYLTYDPNDYQEFDVDDQFFDKLPFRLGDVITFASYAGYKFKVISLAPYGSETYNRIKLCNLTTNEEKYYDTTEINFMTARIVAPADLQQSSFNIENDDRDLL